MSVTGHFPKFVKTLDLSLSLSVFTVFTMNTTCYDCSNCKLKCVHSIRFVRGCNHTICKDCTNFYMWRNNLPPPYFFSKGVTYCPVCLKPALEVKLETFQGGKDEKEKVHLQPPLRSTSQQPPKGFPNAALERTESDPN